MIHLYRTHLLSKSEFEGLEGTELFARLVSNKYELHVPPTWSSIELIDWQSTLCHLIDGNCTGPWHMNFFDHARILLFYFSSEKDACFLEKGMLKCESEKQGDE